MNQSKCVMLSQDVGKGIKQKTKTNKLNSAVPHKEGHQVVLIKKQARYTKLIFFLKLHSQPLYATRVLLLLWKAATEASWQTSGSLTCQWGPALAWSESRQTCVVLPRASVSVCLSLSMDGQRREEETGIVVVRTAAPYESPAMI